jgi:hypothetical protein
MPYAVHEYVAVVLSYGRSGMGSWDFVTIPATVYVMASRLAVKPVGNTT